MNSLWCPHHKTFDEKAPCAERIAAAAPVAEMISIWLRARWIMGGGSGGEFLRTYNDDLGAIPDALVRQGDAGRLRVFDWLVSRTPHYIYRPNPLPTSIAKEDGTSCLVDPQTGHCTLCGKWWYPAEGVEHRVI